MRTFIPHTFENNPFINLKTNTMKTINDIKIGQKVRHWCVGQIVEGEVIEIDYKAKQFRTKHNPVNWGDEIYKTTFIYYNDNRECFIPNLIETD